MPLMPLLIETTAHQSVFPLLCSYLHYYLDSILSNLQLPATRIILTNACSTMSYLACLDRSGN